MNFQDTRNNFRQKKVSAKELTEESIKKAKEKSVLWAKKVLVMIQFLFQIIIKKHLANSLNSIK